MKSMKAGRVRKTAVMSVAALLFAVGVAAALTGCGTTAPAGVAPQVVTGGPQAAGQPDATSPPTTTDTRDEADEQAPADAAPAPASSGAAVQESEVNDCPFYDDGICTRTGEPCTDCR